MTAELQTINIETARAKIFKDASQNLKLLSAYSCVKRTRKHQHAYPVYAGHGRIRNIFRNSLCSIFKNIHWRDVTSRKGHLNMFLRRSIAAATNTNIKRRHELTLLLT